MKRWCNNVDWSLESVLPNINNKAYNNQPESKFDPSKILNFRPGIEGIEKWHFKESNKVWLP